MLNNYAIDRVFAQASYNWHKDEVFQMAKRSNFMADLAQIANGAASAFGGMREEIAVSYTHLTLPTNREV